MKWLISLAVVVVTAGPAEARFMRVALAEEVKRTASIAAVELKAVKTEQWRHSDGSSRTCGYVYTADVHDMLKGEPATTLVFASPASFRVGHRYLFFLSSYSGDFPTDVIVKYEPDAESRRQACLGSLPRLKASWLSWGRFLPGQFVSMSYWLIPPQSAMPAEIMLETVRVRGEAVNLQAPATPSSQEADALFHEHVLGDTVVSWPALKQAIENTLSIPPRE